MNYYTPILIACILFFSGCMHEPIHQGNRLKIGEILQIKEGDTKFYVEQTLGSPVLDSALQPNRVLYYEEYEDMESGEMNKRGVEITYDDALRVHKIRRFGFENEE